MNKDLLSVRELQESDIDSLIQYWFDADHAFLKGMGVDIHKMPDKNEWRKMLVEQVNTPIQEKQSYCIIWLFNDKAIGHSNVNKIIWEKEASMHIHLWNNDNRKNGSGTTFIKMTLSHFFNNLKLKTVYCEPYALNPAPNNTLRKVGFEFVKTYTTTPGWINFEQQVNRWELSYEKFKILKII